MTTLSTISSKSPKPKDKSSKSKEQQLRAGCSRGEKHAMENIAHGGKTYWINFAVCLDGEFLFFTACSEHGTERRGGFAGTLDAYKLRLTAVVASRP